MSNKEQMKKAIEEANARGLGGFHVFCDQELYAGGEWVGRNRYSTSWRSLDVAKAVAAMEVNGRVYDWQGKLIA